MNKKIYLIVFITLLFGMFFIPFNSFAEDENIQEEVENTLVAENENNSEENSDNESEQISENTNNEEQTSPTNQKIEETDEQTNHHLLIEDDANLLSTEERTKLVEDMKPLLKYGHIAFKSISSNYTSAPNYAREYYHNTFSTDSGTVFLIDMYNRKIYIFSDGTNYNVITNHKAEIITDNIYRYASASQYYDCASSAYKQMNTILEGGKILEPMRHISNVVVSLVIAFFVNFIIIYQNAKVKKASQNEIMKNCDVAFSANNIVGHKTGTHSVYSPVSDSSSSSGGGGGGGGGGSSGGGGGHSF